MGRELKDNVREIDGKTYEVFLLPPGEALKVLTRLSKVVGEPLGMAAGGILGGSLMGAEEESEDGAPAGTIDKPIKADVIGRVVRALTDRLDEDMVLETVKTVLSQVQVMDPARGDKGTRRINFNIDFSGDLLSMLKAFAFALEVNYADFFGGSGGSAGLMARARAAVASLK